MLPVSERGKIETSPKQPKRRAPKSAASLDGSSPFSLMFLCQHLHRFRLTTSQSSWHARLATTRNKKEPWLLLQSHCTGAEANKIPANMISMEECEKHNSREDFWVVVDSYVLDLSTFLAHHPAGARKIINKRRQVGPDTTSNFLDHFGHTVRTFREACRQYDRKLSPVVLRFKESGDQHEVLVIGKIAQRKCE